MKFTTPVKVVVVTLMFHYSSLFVPQRFIAGRLSFCCSGDEEEEWSFNSNILPRRSFSLSNELLWIKLPPH